MMNILREFRTFAMRGNVIDLAVAVVVGGGFGKIVTALVDGVIMPVTGVLVSGVDFSELSVVLKEAHGDEPAVLLRYGMFLQSIVDFLIIAFVIFLLIRALNSFKRKEEEAPSPPPEPSPEVKLLTEIRDTLRSRSPLSATEAVD